MRGRPSAPCNHYAAAETTEEPMNGWLTLNRRQFLGTAAAWGAAGALALPAQGAVSSSVANLPSRSSVVIRNAYVITMVPGEADLPSGDVRVENGTIVEVGAHLAASDVPAIEGSGFILMPGMVDTHWHMWTTLLRNMSGNK